MTLFVCLFTGLAAMLVSAGLIRLLRPLLVRYALARPNARSSHRIPTPQGGGIAVLAATLLCAAAGLASIAGADGAAPLLVPASAALVLAIVGGVDDIRPLPALWRFLLQALCVSALVLWSDPARLMPAGVPLVLERAILVLAGIWWVNAVNFMDGIDWITIAEIGPLSGAICGLALAGIVAPPVGLTAAALLGALLGFAPANRPVARLFLGDVGSLPLGLLTGWMLLALAASGALAAALLIPLYYVADATLTLLRRLARGERVWQAHRSHFYQRAGDNGWSVMAIDRRVLALNVGLVVLAVATIRWPDPRLVVACLGLGVALVALTLRGFAAPRLRAGRA